MHLSNSFKWVSLLLSFFLALVILFPKSATAAPSWSCSNSYQNEIRIFEKYGRDFAFKSSGYQDGNKWRLNSNGYIEDSFNLSSNTFIAINVKAKPAVSANGPGDYWPHLQISVDGMQVANIEVDDPAWQHFYIYTKQEGINRSPVFKSGDRKIRISYNNDWADQANNQGRDVRIEKVEVYVEKDGCSLPQGFTLHRSLNKLRIWANQLGFPMGTIMNENGGVSPVDTDTAYANKLKKFKYLTPSNQFKMRSLTYVEDQTEYDRPDHFSDFVQANNKKGLHGHTIVWSKSLPNLSAVYDAPIDFENWLTTYVTNLIQRYPNEFEYWQVVNEPLDWEGNLKTNSLFYQKLGPDYIAKIWQMAEDANQGYTTELILNENGVLDLSEKSDGLYELVENLLNRGIAIDGVGFQAHIDISKQPNFSTIQENIERFVQLGIDVHITELDVRIDENIPNADEVQANIYYQVVSTCLHTNGCESINFWGLTDKYSYSTQQPHLLNANLVAKKALSGVTMALYEKLFSSVLID